MRGMLRGLRGMLDVLTYMVLAESLVITHPVPLVTIGDLKIIK